MTITPTPAVTEAEIKHALSVIKALCVGDACEHGWAHHFQTTKNRMRIADICDDILLAFSTAAKAREPTSEIKRLRAALEAIHAMAGTPTDVTYIGTLMHQIWLDSAAAIAVDRMRRKS